MDLTKSIDPQIESTCKPVKVEAVKSAISQGFLSEEQPLLLIYNLTHFKSEIRRAIDAFPKHFVHTMAVKANPLKALMTVAAETGLGFEAASFGELTQALNVAKNPEKVVFDSPVKTKKELKLSLERGIYLNVDNFQELETVVELIQTQQYPSPNIGIRINPQVGTGTIKEMSTGGTISKFGIAANDFYDQILKAYADYAWLNGIHVHVGSQGCPIDLMLQGIRRIVDIALEVNKRRGFQQIKFIDIGGGLPVNFDDEQDSVGEAYPSFEAYAALLKEKCPELFTGEYKVFTEYGRRFNSKPGFIVSRVEYTKTSGGRKIAAIHAGADLFVRTVWSPQKWAIRVSVVDSKGNLKKSDKYEKQDIVGPCCYSGDVVAHERELPLLERGDYIIAHDTGGYYLSAFSYYNCRQAPAVYTFEEQDVTRLTLVKKAQSVDDTLAFFS